MRATRKSIHRNEVLQVFRSERKAVRHIFLLLPRRPAEGAPAEEVHVEVEDRLPRLAPRVGDEPVAGSVEARPGRHLGGELEDVAEKRGTILAGGVAHGVDVSRRDHEHVRRSLRMEVAEGNRVFVARDDLGRDLARHDPAEDAIVSHRLPVLVPSG